MMFPLPQANANLSTPNSSILTLIILRETAIDELRLFDRNLGFVLGSVWGLGKNF
jgi:hypothetical protein